VHAVVCTVTGLPLAWTVRTAAESEQEMVPGLLDTLAGRGFAPGVAVLDKGYDVKHIYDTCESLGMRPVIPLKMTPGVKAGWDKPPSCDHGIWTFAGSDIKRGASKWRCPTGECTVASRWVKADRLHPLIPRHTDKWKALYKRRTAVERGFGRLKRKLRRDRVSLNRVNSPCSSSVGIRDEVFLWGFL
jgi:hypothetical protein